MTTDKLRKPGQSAGREDIDDSDQAADTRKPNQASQAAMSDKSGMLGEGDPGRDNARGGDLRP